MRVTAPHQSPWWQVLLATMGLLFVSAATADDTAVLKLGKQIAFDPAKGNCLACHQIEGGESAGDLGPPLVGLKTRFPNKNILRQHLWDPMVNNPGTRMPPFGRHRILSEDELDLVVEYIYTL